MLRARDLFRLAVHEDDRHVTRAFGAAKPVCDFAAMRRHARKIDHHRIRQTRADLAHRKHAVAEVKCGIKTKGLELLLPLEAFVFVPVDQSDCFHLIPDP